MPGLVSIILLAWNQLKYTQMCIDSLYGNTKPRYELILVDNGSTDGTGDYFTHLQKNIAKQQPKSPVRIELVTNAKNLGFSRGVNQGLKSSQGDFFLLLNNDTIVTPNWLENLLTCLDSSPQVGIVGPRSNYAAVTGIRGLSLNTLEEIDSFARRYNQQDPEKWLPVEWLPGFCLLIKRQLIDTIGGLDQRFNYGFMEDVELGQRASQAGYINMCAGDTFVYHFGSKTFTGNGLNIDQILQENWAKYAINNGRC